MALPDPRNIHTRHRAAAQGRGGPQERFRTLRRLLPGDALRELLREPLEPDSSGLRIERPISVPPVYMAWYTICGPVDVGPVVERARRRLAGEEGRRMG